MAFLGGYVFFVGPLLCFFRGVIAMLSSWGHCNAFFMRLWLCIFRGAISLLFRLGPSLSHFADVLFRKTNGTTKSRKTRKPPFR
jgi:hypothetical protein